jgi:hypothetical protein
MRVDFAPFLAWSDAKGISSPLELVTNGSYRYMALPPDKEVLLSQSKSPGLVNIVQAPLEACLVGDDFQSLVEKLKYEKALGDRSDYAPWLSLFPTLDDFQGMPRFWSPDRRDFVRKYDGGQLEARMDIDRLRFNEVDDPWALACVDSRSNFLPDNTYSMTPMLDMFNHDPRVKTSARVDGAERFLLEVDSESIFSAEAKEQPDWKDQLFGMFGGGAGDTPSYTPGSEVYVSYGDFDNLETLCNYGFVAVDNVAKNIESFRVRMVRKAPVGLIVDSTGSMDNIFNQMSLTDLRVNLATPSELESLTEDYDGGKMSDRNEVEVFALIAGELEEALYDAKAGAKEAEAMNDSTVANYLRGRQATLEKGRDWLKENFPDMF